MEDRESSTASSIDFYDSEKKPDNHLESVPSDAGAVERKADDILSVEEKKRRLASSSPSTPCNLKPCAGLPPEVWQHIFLFCSLHDLGRLLQVNRSFHSYLTDVSSVSFSDPNPGSLHLLKSSESIWAFVRNTLPVKPPKPPRGFSELQVWQLVWSKRCQFCRRLSSFIPGDKIWQKGPSTCGVRTIWPFGIKSCGPCLMDQSQTDASLLFSSASALRPALPFALITSDHHYVPAYTLQAATTPPGLEISKFYYKKHVEDIEKELKDALSLGSGAAEEWSKGLEARGIECMRVVEQWERWEVKYQWWTTHHGPKQATSAALDLSSTASTLPEKPKSPARQPSSPVIHSPVPTGTFSSTLDLVTDGSLFQRFHGTPTSSLTTAATPSRFVQSRPPTIPHQYTPQPGPTSGGQSMRGNLHEANEAKANRKADIERRCQDINPPIPPNVLRHMDSFKAALQISQPMTEHAWSVLEPRLLAQLPAAQQAEADHVARAASVSKLPERRPPEVNSKEAKEVMDREWDETQQPVREKLSVTADEYINRTWDQGRTVTYENSPKFAVDLLVYVRLKYYSDAEKAVPASTWDTKFTPENINASSRPKLVLENMKWVYDNKVKPLTEQYRKEIFLCYRCESNYKYYGFEGVIQHYGAKHTNAFSVGNVVVAWREAEWPAETPFHPDPISVKHAYHATPNPSSHAGYGAYYGGYSRAGTSTPHTQAHLPQVSPGPYHYAGHYNGPFAPPQIRSSVTPGYDYNNQAYGVPMDSYQYQSMAPPTGYGPPGNGYLASSSMPIPTMTGSLPANHRQDDILHRPEESDHRTGLYDKQVSTIISEAQDIWKQMSGIKGLPNSLRIYVVLQGVISKFHLEFNHEPDLNHFIDAFSNNETPRALRYAPGLSCKTCQEDSSHHHHPTQEERRTYTALSMFSHFRSHHSNGQFSSYASGQARNTLDWKEDMIELPSDRFISGLIHAPGMDDEKLRMIATVFPALFPTPLPKIGSVDGHTVALPEKMASKEPKSSLKGEASGIPSESSGPSSLASPYTGSPRTGKPTPNEYDPQQPALSGLGHQVAAQTNRRGSYWGSSPPMERKSRSYADQSYYLPRDPLSREILHPGEIPEFQSNQRRYRETRPYHEDFHERQSLYRGHDEAFYRPGEDHGLTYPRNGLHASDYRPSSRQFRHPEAARYSVSDARYVGESRGQNINLSEEKLAADQVLEDFVPSRPSTNEQLDVRDKPLLEPDLDDGSRYSPPPVNTANAGGVTDQHRLSDTAQPPPPSTVSNGSRYEEGRPARRPILTPDSARGSRRPGPQRPRDRQHGGAPSRYYRYMSVARDEPYSRGASISRSQSKRYEEQRRRIDEQETPQPTADREQPYSRDHSVERAPTDDNTFHGRPVPREYVSVQDRPYPLPSPRYRYSRYSEESRGPAPVFVDDHGYPFQEYEIVRIPREPQPARGSYAPHSPTRYMEHEPEDVRYIPVSYDPPYSHRYDGGTQRVYYDERERHPGTRRPTYTSETAYEPALPEIKVEAIAPVTEAP